MKWVQDGPIIWSLGRLPVNSTRAATHTMFGQTGRASGITLVQMLVVVIIVIILAAMLISKFDDMNNDVKTSALKTELQRVRSQLELYKLQHKNQYPQLQRFTTSLTGKTDADGHPDPAGSYGPYFPHMPENPIDNSSQLSPVQNGSGGWMYDGQIGSFKSNDPSVTDPESQTKDL